MGNVFQLCNDFYEERYYINRPANEPDPQGPNRGDKHTLRGGSFLQPLDEQNSSHREFLIEVGAWRIGAGFRIAASPK